MSSPFNWSLIVKKRPKFEEYKETLVKLYLEEDKPVYQVAAELDLSTQTVSSWLKRAGVEIVPSQKRRSREQQDEVSRKISESKTGKTLPVIEQTQCIAPDCTNIVESKLSRKFCSQRCGDRARYTARHGSERMITCPTCGAKTPNAGGKTYCSGYCRNIDSSAICPCGKNCVKEGRSLGARYCSQECTDLYKPTRESIYGFTTFSCETCNKLRTVKTNYFNALSGRWCSVECAPSRSSRIRHIDLKDLRLSGSLEINFWFLCYDLDIELSECVPVKLESSQWKTYRPDFNAKVLGLDLVIETKGWNEYGERTRHQRYREQYGPLLVLDTTSLQQFEESPDRELWLLERHKRQQDAFELGLQDDTAMRAMRIELREPAYRKSWVEKYGSDVDFERSQGRDQLPRLIEFWEE